MKNQPEKTQQYDDGYEAGRREVVEKVRKFTHQNAQYSAELALGATGDDLVVYVNDLLQEISDKRKGE